MESPVLVRVEPGALVHGGGAAAMVTEEVVQRTLGMFAGPGLSVQSGEVMNVMQTCVLELETKVHTKDRNLLVVLCLTNVLNVIALVGTFNQEKAQVGAFSVIAKSSFQALMCV